MIRQEKVLINFPADKLAPKGEPAGYLYNLHHGLERIVSTNFVFSASWRLDL